MGDMIRYAYIIAKVHSSKSVFGPEAIAKIILSRLKMQLVRMVFKMDYGLKTSKLKSNGSNHLNVFCVQTKQDITRSCTVPGEQC